MFFLTLSGVKVKYTGNFIVVIFSIVYYFSTFLFTYRIKYFRFDLFNIGNNMKLNKVMGQLSSKNWIYMDCDTEYF